MTSAAPTSSNPVHGEVREAIAYAAPRPPEDPSSPAPVFPFRLSWRWKVIVPLMLLSVIGIAGITWVSVSAQQSLLLRTASVNSASVAASTRDMIDTVAPPPDPARLQPMLERARDEHGLANAWITDATGRVLTATTSQPPPRGLAPLSTAARLQDIDLARSFVYTTVALRTQPRLVLVIQTSFRTAAESERSLVHRILLLAAVGMIGSALVIYFLLMLLIDRPLQELRNTMLHARMREWNRHVHFDRRKDEIGDLARYYNGMVDAFDQSCRACDAHYQLQLARSEHFATLGQVAAGLAHEIRNPLAGIAAALDVLSSECDASDPRHEIMQEVQHQVARIKGTVNELVNYARPRPLQLTAGDLNATIEHVVEFSRAQAHRVDIHFHPQELPPVTHDPDQMQRLVMNLVLNALDALREHPPGAGQVVIRTRRKTLASGQGGGPAIHIEVSDNGRGIEPAEMEKIFRPFYTRGNPNGNGLGLSLCRRIAEMHQGRITVRSTPGSGSTFTVELPERLSAATLPTLADYSAAAGGELIQL